MTTTEIPAAAIPPVALEPAGLADGVPAGAPHARRAAFPQREAAGVGVAYAIDADAAQLRLLHNPLLAASRRAALVEPDDDDAYSIDLPDYDT